MTALADRDDPRVDNPDDTVPLSPGARFVAVMVAATLLVPANLVVAGPLKSLGSASRLLGLLALGIVVLVFIRRELARSVWGRRVAGSAAVPFVLIMYVIAITALYGISYRRLMAPEEVSGGTRALFGAMALAGAALAAALFVDNRRGLRTVMGCVVGGVGFSAFVGLLQSRIPLDLAAMLRFPGLSLNSEVSTSVRNSLTRVLGSAGHPIEFTVILAGAVPLALYVATYASTKARRQMAGLAAALMLFAIPLGVSRSGVLGIGVALLCYGVVWTWRQRLTALALAMAGLVFYRIIQPRVLGTIYGLFSNASTDNSITGRTEDYPRLDALLAGRELLGIGPGTFLPDVYFILDNQWLVSYAEGGVIGVVAFAAVPLVGMIVVQVARRRAVDPAVRDAAQAIFAAIAATALCATTFDMLAFQQVSFMLFVYVGLASAALVVASTDSGRAGAADFQLGPLAGTSAR